MDHRLSAMIVIVSWLPHRSICFTRFRSIKSTVNVSVETVGEYDIVIIFHCFIVVNSNSKSNFNVKVGGVLSQIVCVGLFFTCKLLLFLCFSLLFFWFLF